MKNETKKGYSISPIIKILSTYIHNMLGTEHRTNANVIGNKLFLSKYKASDIVLATSNAKTDKT